MKPNKVKKICRFKGRDYYFKKDNSYILEISEQKSNVLRKGKLEDGIMVVAYNKTLNMAIPYLSMNCFLKNWEIIG